MLLREDDRGVLAIGQSSHAWISGQFARAWGNDRFGLPEPYEEVCLAAEQHDIGMALWDLDPTRNPDTGLPHSFMEMPIDSHLPLWSAAPKRLLAQSRYAALLVSMHGRRLYELRDLDTLPENEADAIRAYFDEQRSFQDELLASLRANTAAAPSATPELVARNSQLIWTWDFLSLAVCLDWSPTTAQRVPTVENSVDLRLTRDDGSGRLTLDPWPFTRNNVTVRCEGRRLTGRFDTDDDLRHALAQAPWETVLFELVA
jgi:hypothetical protein